MQITLLPPLLPSDGVVPVRATHQAFTPGTRVLATVLGTALDGGTLLSLGGREVPTGGTLPYPPGTRLRLEVVEGGPQPLLRMLSSDVVPIDDANEAAAPVAPENAAAPVSSVTYALAAAVLAAREGRDVRGAAITFARWVPVLVSKGVLGASLGEALLEALAAVRVEVGPPSALDGTGDPRSVARAIADRVNDGGLLLERRLGEIARLARPEAAAAAATDLRSRLALAGHLLAYAPPGLEGAREALTELQTAVLTEQARTAAYLARDGVLDVRIPLQIAPGEAELCLRLRIERDTPAHHLDDDSSPWRQVRLDVALEGLGRVQVRIRTARSQVRTEFLVEHPASADRLEAGLPELDAALSDAGFAEVLSRVVVDPVRACAPEDLPDLPLQGSILDTRA
jgi:hypothetical protein